MKKIEITDLKHEVSDKHAADVKGGEGLPTGKRQHKPIRISKPIDKATP